MASVNPAGLPDDEAMRHYVDAASAVLGIEIDPAWREPILGHLKTISLAANFVEAYVLPDDLSAAPVFEA